MDEETISELKKAMDAVTKAFMDLWNTICDVVKSFLESDMWRKFVKLFFKVGMIRPSLLKTKPIHRLTLQKLCKHLPQNQLLNTGYTYVSKSSILSG